MKQIPLAIASAALLAVATAASPPALTVGDVETMRDYVGKNRAYSPVAPAEAMRRVDRLPSWLGWPARFELPGAGAMLLYATERHNYMTGCPEADCHAAIRDHPIRVATLQPDISTPLRFEDFVAGRDPAMEAILRDIGAPAR